MNGETHTDQANVLVTEAADGVWVLTLNRPERLNAISWELLDDLHGALERLAQQPRLRVLVLTGAGRGFCSGLDLKSGDDPLGVEDGVEAFLARQEKLALLAIRLAELQAPVVAAINGPAAGGGFSIALASDIRICSNTARFNAAFVRIGLSGGDIGVSYNLPRLVGSGLAAELMLTGRFVDAEEALAIGLVTRVVDEGELMTAALQIADQIAANSPFGIKMTKELLRANIDASSLQAALHLENRTQTLASMTPGHGEALTAFLERRPPIFRVPE